MKCLSDVTLHNQWPSAQTDLIVRHRHWQELDRATFLERSLISEAMIHGDCACRQAKTDRTRLRHIGPEGTSSEEIRIRIGEDQAWGKKMQ